jgi:hypothetical protein
MQHSSISIKRNIARKRNQRCYSFHFANAGISSMQFSIAIFHMLKKNVNKILLNIFLVRENYF